VHAQSQFLLDFLELGPHAVTPALALQQEAPLSRFPTNEGEPQELEGFRHTESTPGASVRREAAELDQAGLVRMQRQRKLLQSLAHRIKEASGVAFVLEADDEVKFTFLLVIPTQSASSASCVPRPGRNPYENPRKSSS
jgi:hypothetical protein